MTEQRFIDTWFTDHHLTVTWCDDRVFELAGDKYLYVRVKSGGDSSGNEVVSLIIDPDQFELLLDPVEYDLSQTCKWLCFEFGGQVYRTQVNEPLKFEPLKYVGQAIGYSGFPFLGVHGGYELGAGSRDYADWCRKAKFLGPEVNALGLCERHTLAGALKFQQACEKAKLKPILGETVTILDGKVTYRVKLYVANETGWANLLRLHKVLQVDHAGEYVTRPDLIEHSEGLFAVFCADSNLSEDILADYFFAKFKELYFQLDPVTWRAVQRDLQHLSCLKRAIELKLPLVLICDAYYLDQPDHRVKPFLKFVSKGQFEYASQDQHFKSLEEVATQVGELFESKGLDYSESILLQGLENLQNIVENCNFKVKTGEIHMPKYVMTEAEAAKYSTSLELFWGLVEEGIATLPLKDDLQVYLDRIQKETDLLIRGNFTDYFLIIRDIINWCEANDIMVGTGRGSIGGALTGKLLNLTKVDAIEYDLLFERFLSSSRIGKGLPDADTDVVSARRDDIKRYMEQRFGVTSVCSIGAYTTLASKSAFRDLLRFAGESPATVNYFAAIFGKKSDDELTPYLKKLAASPKLRQFADDHPYVINDLELVLNQPKSTTIHASGVLIVPTEYNGDDR